MRLLLHRVEIFLEDTWPWTLILAVLWVFFAWPLYIIAWVGEQ